MNFRSALIVSTATVAMSAALSGTAFAQSTGTVDFEQAIVVLGTRSQEVIGVSVPDTSKARQVLTQEHIARQNPGQTILDTINIVPGVNFTNNDAYGSAGGQLNIRGFSQDRISLTFDGIPLNDSGNYQIYSNQQLDPELIEQVNVNLGTTDVDSPTAAATGSTVNYRTRLPGESFGARLSGSAGEFSFMRIFGMIDTGAITPFGTRAFVSASMAENDNPYNNYGRIRKQQYNARIFQPIASNGDFVSVSGHYNQNRNNFFGSVAMRTDRATPNGFPTTRAGREYTVDFPCTINLAAGPGAQTPNSCGTQFDRRYNPSNTGNLRGSSRFALAEGLVLSVDPSYQYVKANGGGTVGARERLIDVQPGAGVTNLAGYVGGRPYFGMDLNGDGDLLDEVTVLAPSQTQTHRYGVIANLRWDFASNHSLRIGYTFDRARHRQTGEVGGLLPNGEPVDVFPVNNPLKDATGGILQKRDRLSYAILHQVSAEYRGKPLDGLTVTLGVRAPFFKRDLNNFCFTTSDTGFVDCFGRNDPRNAVYAAVNPTVQGPQQRVLKYDRILPNIGLIYNVSGPLSVFANYSKGLQVPGTDALYNAFFFPANTPSARPSPETTDNFDLGVRFRTGRVQAQASAWFTRYQNRLASAYDPVTDRNLYRNLGTVDKWGLDGSIAWQPVDAIAVYLFGSYLKSKIKENVQSGECTAAQLGVLPGCAAVGDPIFIATKGRRESGAPVYTFGGSARAMLGPVEIGATAKRTGGRYVYDTNLPIFGGTAAAPTILFPAKTNAYWLVNLDARVKLDFVGMGDKAFLQFNVYNLFNELYVGNFPNGLNQGNVIGKGVFTGAPGSPPFAQIGAPRTISATVTFAF